jgi:hypothetical protein
MLPRSLTLALTPAGMLVLREATDADPIDPAAERIRAALARGVSHGLLQLGAAEVATTLPSGIALWRVVGRAPSARKDPGARRADTREAPLHD